MQNTSSMMQNASSQTLHPPTSHSMAPLQPNSTTSAANWDQYKGSHHTFSHPLPSHQSIKQSHAKNKNLNMHNIGAHCTHFILDPHEMHPIVSPITNSIPPWHAYQLNHDVELLHFPAAIPNACVYHDLFITSFNHPWDSKNQADFLKNIPPLPQKL